MGFCDESYAAQGADPSGQTRVCEPHSDFSSTEDVDASRPGVQETSPDCLKNTPTNISKLEDVIESCKSRQKYIAQTLSPSDGGDVRWYFCKVPLGHSELSASIPGTEIVGRSEYFRFGMRDSLAIEACFLQREEELLSSWWRELADCSEGPKGRQNSNTEFGTKQRMCSNFCDSTQSFDMEERVGVPVKGGLYEVDILKRHCFPIYWSGGNRRVLRGHWFARKSGLDWLPLREDVSEQLELAYYNKVWHRRTFQPSGLFAARVDLQATTLGLHALFTGEDNNWEALLNVDASGFSSVIGFGGSAIKLRRGYSVSQSQKQTQDELRQQKEEEMDDYCSQVPVRHVIFMVHGIGQRLEKSNLVDDVGNFRCITEYLGEMHLTSHQRRTQRVLFIPCQWRRGLKLTGETAVEKITLEGVRALRLMLSATVHDVLYYMSPIHCQDIINSVSNQLNRLYLKFISRNPGYDGKVSIYGHSLGSVLSYDIICHQDKLSSPFPMGWMYKEYNGNKKYFTPISPSMGSKTRCDGVCCDDDPPTQPRGNCERMEPALNLSLRSKYTMNPHEVMSCLPFSEGVSRDSFDIYCSIINQQGDEFDKSVSKVSLVNSRDLGAETSEKGGEIRLLKDEIIHLKARITALESRSGDERGRIEACTTTQTYTSPAPDDFCKNYTPYIKYTKLEFQVDTFFAVGSPLGVFLALRNVRIGIGQGGEYWGDGNISEEMPACQKMFNIFHPFDPVAYRIEPLICKECIEKRPVTVPYHRGGKRLHIGFQDFAENITIRSQKIVGHISSLRNKMLTLCQSKDADKVEDEREKKERGEERTYGARVMESLSGSIDGRIDHMLQDKTFEHSYISAIGSHTNYWRDYDTALFILKHLYSDIAEEPDSPSGSGPDHNYGSEGKEEMDEDMPLTFSDRVRVASFSKRAKDLFKNKPTV